VTLVGRIGYDHRHELEDSIAARTSGVRVQVIGASNERGRVRLMQSEIRRLLGPDAIVEDWTVHVEAAIRAGVFEAHMSRGARAAANMRNVDAVETCDVLWFLVPDGESCMSWNELGIATGLRRGASSRRQLIVASGASVYRSICTEQADELHELDSAARDSITRFAAHRARAVGG
jgi:hypothetical protein